MGKKTKEELFENVLAALDNKKNTVNEIATHIGSNWSTVKETLELLKKYNLVDHYTEKNTKIYVRQITAKKIYESTNDTFFKLPVTTEQKNLAHSLFGAVQEEYRKLKGVNPGKILAQKVVEDLEEEHKVDLPSGWYLYGRTTVFSYDPAINYPIMPNLVTDTIKKNISSLANEYSKIKTAEDMMYHQYKKHDNKLYLTKWNLSKISSDKINFQNKETKQALQIYLANFLLYLPDGKYSDKVEEVVNKYIITMNKLLLGNENLNLIKPQLNRTFDSVWKYVATVNFYNDLLGFYKEMDLEQIRDKIFMTGPEAIEQIDFISEYYSPPAKLPTLGIETPEEEAIRGEFIDMSKN